MGGEPGYGAPAPYDPNAPADGDRGLGKALLVGAGAAIAGMGAYGIYSKTAKKKKHVKTKHGKTREIDCDVLVDQNGHEIPGQEFDENGRCINENEVLSRAGNGQPQPYGANYQAPTLYQQNYAQPPQPYGHGAPDPYNMPHYNNQPMVRSLLPAPMVPPPTANPTCTAKLLLPMV